jgi:hypothetical protein
METNKMIRAMIDGGTSQSRAMAEKLNKIVCWSLHIVWVLRFRTILFGEDHKLVLSG